MTNRKNSITKGRKNQRGIAASEYIIVLVLVAASAIGLFRVYGTSLQGRVTAATADLDGTLNTNPVAPAP